MKRTFKFEFEGATMTVTVERRGNDIVVERGGERYHITLLPGEDTGVPSASLSRSSVPSAADAPRPSEKQSAEVKDQVAPTGSVAAPITGTVKEVLVNVGDSVSEGERVMMMEAMKMDIEIVAPSSGKIGRTFVKAGDNVKERQPLFSVE